MYSLTPLFYFYVRIKAQRLANGKESSTFHYAVAGSHTDTRNGTVGFGRDVVFHFHSFEHQHRFALLHSPTGSHEYFRNHAGQRSLNGSAGTGTVGCSRSSSRSLSSCGAAAAGAAAGASVETVGESLFNE